MAQKSENLGTDDGSNSEPIDRVHELSWALFDELITDEQMVELEGLLLNDTTAREAYIHCVQLHADLSTHYAKTATPSSGTPSKTPVLGFLCESQPQFGAPTVDDATA